MDDHAQTSPPPNLAEQVAVRAMQGEDIPSVIRLAEHIWHRHYPAIIPAAQIDYMLARGYSPEALARTLAQNHDFLLAERRGRLVGFLHALTPFQPDWPGDRQPQTQDGFVRKWYVDPAAHGHGIGRLLWQELRQRRDAPAWWLRVNRDNIKAVDFYRYLGFTAACQHDLDIGGGFSMNDYVMRWAG